MNFTTVILLIQTFMWMADHLWPKGREGHKAGCNRSAQGCGAQLELRFVLVLLLWNFELLPTPEALSGFASFDKITHQPQKCYVRLKELVQSK